MTRQPYLSIVMPVYREGPHLRDVLKTVRDVLESMDESYELIVVDDGSPDDTWAILGEEAREYPMLRAMRLSRNFGKESALSAGLEASRGDGVIVMDGDLQHPPELIPEMVGLWRESGADVVEAVKEGRGPEPFVNKMGARAFYAILSRMSGYDLEGASDFKLMNRRVVNAWLRMGERNLFFRGMIAWLGFRRAQLTFSVPERSGGRTKWSNLRLVNLAITAVTSFSTLMLQFITFFGGLFLVFAIVLGAQTLLFKITGRAVNGFTTVILLQLIIGSLLMISLGIIGMYLGRIYDEVKARPRYVISAAIGGTPEDQS